VALLEFVELLAPPVPLLLLLALAEVDDGADVAVPVAAAEVPSPVAPTSSRAFAQAQIAKAPSPARVTRRVVTHPPRVKRNCMTPAYHEPLLGESGKLLLARHRFT
jgi:hypothetical protein